MKKQSSLVVVPDADKGSAGLITWWKLVDSDSERLRVAWKRNVREWSEDHLPDPPSASVALRRSLKTLYENPKAKVQTCPGGTYAIVDVSYEDDDEDKRKNPIFTTRFKVWQTKGELHYSKECAQDQKKAIWKAYQIEFSLLSSRDLSAWLIGIAESIGAVRLRESGGIYFIPQSDVELWESVSAAVEFSCSRNCVYGVPAMKTESAVRAVMDALEAEATSALSQIEASLERNEMRLPLSDKQELGTRALETRRGACADLMQKVARYEKLLGQKRTDLRSAIKAMDARLSEAMLAAQ